ncbi:hypothetical protein DYBT9275_03482 [Dyadobacter sp. CECT 9275]|uniref:Outer membrane protein beta-barrel domain-containing protein n=1 Tax=Dyadobacter helix TaxID=2822344 RepID=A0A916JE28_9BACT|nr:hypothetical protein [Dyadobacter sp. CECT 9275]CAG5004948.1 hypothetical protein DYBT9275_03482 [Dyadobacter sp. CECT 9275]
MSRLSLVLFVLLMSSFYSLAQTPAGKKPATAKPTAAPQKSKAQPAKKPVTPVKTDKLYQLDGTTIIRGTIFKVTEDSVSYYTVGTKRIKKTVAKAKLSKIVYANGTTKIIEQPVVQKEEVVKQEQPAAVIETVEKTEEPVKQDPVLDEIVLKTGDVISGRITSQQKSKVGFRPASDPESGAEQFVTTSKIWKLRYGATAQEVILNPVKEKKEPVAKTQKVKTPKEPKPVRETSSAERIYKPFKVDVTLGYPQMLDSDGDFNWGFVLSVEPKYNITDNIAAGLKIEAAGFVSSEIDYGVSGLLLMSSYMATGEYQFGTKKVRPFVGIAAGLFQPKLYLMADDEETVSVTMDNIFGFAPRAGVQLGHFRIAAEFNLAKDSKNDINYNYFSIKTGATIGGGKKRR